jgi:predicted metal-dependent RNase
MRQEVATKGQEEPNTKQPVSNDKNKSIIENINWDGTNLRDEKTTSEMIQPILSEKSSEVASMFREMTSKIHSKGMNDDKYKQPSLLFLRKANAIVRPYLMKDQFNREVNDNVKYQLTLIDKQFEGSMNQEKSNIPQQSSSFLTSIV